jgi:hypothetical protein
MRARKARQQSHGRPECGLTDLKVETLARGHDILDVQRTAQDDLQ